MTLDTLGVSALLYALAGYWTGRYGETTGRDRGHAPLLAVLVATIAIAFAGYGLHFLLGEEVSARRALFDDPAAGARAQPAPRAAQSARSGRPSLAQADDLRPRDRGASSLASSYPQRRSSSRRFLPPDPRASEPYRFTPQLALRVGVLAALALVIFAILFLRLWALQVLSGDRYLNAAQNNQLRTSASRRRAARSSTAPATRSSRTCPARRCRSGPPTCPRRAATRCCKRLSKILRVPLPQADARRSRRARTTADADPRQDGGARGPGGDAARAPGRVPGRLGRRHLPARLREPCARGAGARLRRRDHAEESSGSRGEDGYRGGEKIGKTGVEAAYDRYLRGTPGTAQLRVDSLGRPRGRVHEPRRPAQPGNNVRLTLDIGLQRAAERALRDGIELAHRTTIQRERRRDRRARPARRRGAARWRPTRPTSRPSTSAASTRRSSSRSTDREGREGAELPGHQPRDRRASIRPARRSSR